MSPSFELAWRYLRRNPAKLAILAASLALLAAAPVTARLLIGRLQLELRSRAKATPLVFGAQGSRLDLVLHALYFERAPREPVGYGESLRIAATGLATPMPLLARNSAAGRPLVGCTMEYFEFRGLRIARGQPLTTLGECVLGAEAAVQLGLQPGDSLFSDGRDVFELAGVYPLKMRVVGVLHRNQSPDDGAVFVDLKTAWVVEGLGHGHQDLASVAPDEDPNRNAILERNDDEIIASPAIQQYNEITPDNISSFHFHGDMATFPVSAILVQAHDDRSETLLLGRYVGPQQPVQAVQPAEVVEQLLGTIFRVQRIFDLLAGVLGVAMLVLVGLVTALSLKLRRREMHTMFKLGCSRGMTARLLAAELMIVFALAGVGAAALSWSAVSVFGSVFRGWIV